LLREAFSGGKLVREALSPTRRRATTLVDYYEHYGTDQLLGERNARFEWNRIRDSIARPLRAQVIPTTTTTGSCRLDTTKKIVVISSR
jgi:hypothetical protein